LGDKRNKKDFELKRFSSYQFGGADRIYVEQLVFMEDLHFYYKEYKKRKIEELNEQLEARKKPIEKHEAFM
jgi:hypothetical protein